MAMDALITGASTGIGRAAVKVLAGHGWRVFAGVRKVGRRRIAAQPSSATRCVRWSSTSPTPPGSSGGRGQCASRLAGETLKGLVNNAGMALGGPLALQPIEEIRRVFEVNVLGAVTVSQAFIPLLGGDRSLTGGPGRIVNITSVGGVLAPPFIGDYVMSKHALRSLHRLPAPRTDALRDRRDRDRPRRRRDADLGQGARRRPEPLRQLRLRAGARRSSCKASSPAGATDCRPSASARRSISR